MSRYPPQAPPPNGMDGGRLPHRHSGDFRSQVPNGNGALPLSTVPNGRMSNGHPAPSNKNTSHVPCKFFRQGTCQAGKACPFSHSTEPITETPCKYFQKGNCKFGYKCALAHILPNGTRAPSGNYRPTMPMSAGNHNPLNLGGRLNLHHPEPTTASSLLTMQQAHLAQPQGPAPYALPPDSPPFFPQQHPKPPYDQIPTIDTTFSSHPGSAYGSPPNDSRLAVSPANRGLSVLDAPLPASFDSQGISTMARYGPLAASVPSRFGLEASSPPSSLPKKTGGFNDSSSSSALRTLRSSAFGAASDVDAGSRNALRGGGGGGGGGGGSGFLATSPPLVPQDDGVGRRIMHSERFSSSRARPGLSASLGAAPPARAPSAMVGGLDDWDEGFAFEEDFLPTSLHELLTPMEKMRRFSRNGGDEDHNSGGGGGGGGGGSANIHIQMNMGQHRQAMSGLASPAESGPSKVGSPSTQSPSRFGGFFERRYAKHNTNNNNNNNNNNNAELNGVGGNGSDAAPLSSSAGPSTFGHVGSPLRSSSLHPGASPSLRPTQGASPRPTGAGGAAVAGDVSPWGASPPRRESGGWGGGVGMGMGMGMSMLSRELQRTRIQADEQPATAAGAGAASPGLHPTTSPSASGPPAGTSGGVPPASSLHPGTAARLTLGERDRVPSASSLGRAEKIVEEDGGGEGEELFSIEDVGTEQARERERERERAAKEEGSRLAQPQPQPQPQGKKRFSGGWGFFQRSASGGASPSFGPVGGLRGLGNGNA